MPYPWTSRCPNPGCPGHCPQWPGTRQQERACHLMAAAKGKAAMRRSRSSRRGPIHHASAQARMTKKNSVIRASLIQCFSERDRNEIRPNGSLHAVPKRRDMYLTSANWRGANAHERAHEQNGTRNGLDPQEAQEWAGEPGQPASGAAWKVLCHAAPNSMLRGRELRHLITGPAPHGSSTRKDFRR